MEDILVDAARNLGAALLAGSAIGIERSFNGRPAGFRTHALVCVSSALLMLVTTYQPSWLGRVPLETVRTDPTRMAQGIMTGIGFLGAGVIFKEGLTVRGLTTAASIWMTAAIGTLLGVGYFVPGALATGITLFTLGLFRLVEAKMPTRYFVRCVVRVRREAMLAERDLRELLRSHHFSTATMSYHLLDGGDIFEYQVLIRAVDRTHMQRLSESLLQRREVVGFQLSSMAN
jgi:putative Mg2+ transporter-C (MgtC) family protein